MSKSSNTNEAFEALKEYLMQSGVRFKLASGGREIVKRCHICGDSRDPTDAHMYIGLRNDGKICYNCFKCNAGGYVDGKFLRDIGCYNPDIAQLCQTNNEINSNNYNGRIYKKNLIIPDSNDDFSLKKLEYLKKRTGVEFNNRGASSFKTILNLMDFLNINNIAKYTRNVNLMDPLSKFFIGFLSTDNNYVILRRLIPEGKLPKYIDERYLVYNIFNSKTGLKFYTIPTRINVLEPVEVHIAEGVFDILSIYLNVSPIGTNGIYGAVCGKSYSSLIQHIISTYGITGFDLHIYADNDVSNDKILRSLNYTNIYGIRVFIHRNTFEGEKDYGVPIERIIDSIYKI